MYLFISRIRIFFVADKKLGMKKKKIGGQFSMTHFVIESVMSVTRPFLSLRSVDYQRNGAQ